MQLLLPEGISVEASAFQYCASLGQIDFPKNIKQIGKDAFLGCENLVMRCIENFHAHALENGIPYILNVGGLGGWDKNIP